MTTRTIRLTPHEWERLRSWGPSLSAAVRRVLVVADAVRVYADDTSGTVGDSIRAWRGVESLLQLPPSTRDRVRAGLEAGRSVRELAAELCITPGAVRHHVRALRGEP